MASPVMEERILGSMSTIPPLVTLHLFTHTLTPAVSVHGTVHFEEVREKILFYSCDQLFVFRQLMALVVSLIVLLV